MRQGIQGKDVSQRIGCRTSKNMTEREDGGLVETCRAEQGIENRVVACQAKDRDRSDQAMSAVL